MNDAKRKALSLFIIASCVAFLAIGCEVGEGVSPATPVRLAVYDHGRPAFPVAVSPAVTGSVATYYETTTTLEVEKQAEVLARVEGVIGSLAVEEGDLVEAEGELLTIENDQYRLLYEQARHKTASIQTKHDRCEQMLSQKLVAAEEYDLIKNELGVAESDEAVAKLDLDRTTVRSPFAGQVVTRLVDIGQNVTDGTPLFAVADFNPLLARVHVPAKEFRRIQIDQDVELVLDSNRARLRGTVKLVSPTIDPKTGTIKITVEVSEYPSGTRPGDFVEVHIVTARHDKVTIVPRVAVLEDKGEQVVYVAQDERADYRLVEVGFVDDEKAEIISGVAPGERVIVKGQRSLKPGSPIKTLSEEVSVSSATVESAPPSRS